MSHNRKVKKPRSKVDSVQFKVWKNSQISIRPCWIRCRNPHPEIRSGSGLISAGSCHLTFVFQTKKPLRHIVTVCARCVCEVLGVRSPVRILLRANCWVTLRFLRPDRRIWAFVAGSVSLSFYGWVGEFEFLSRIDEFELLFLLANLSFCGRIGEFEF